ncbi:MAG: TonB-dependent receptor, partial [Rhodothermales bacterium]|nr:TonB-dependent receptor [Rhodothermales bacterium]
EQLLVYLSERPIDIPEIVVERVMLTGGKRGLYEVPGSAHFLGPRELEAFSYNDIQRILAEIPGINIQEEDGYGLRPNIGIRGTGAERSSKITLMEDGVLMAPAPYAAPAAYYFPTAGRMEAVEVRKGSSQIKYGPFTTGGAINLLSTQIPDRFSGYTQIQAGTRDNRTVHAYVGHSVDNAGFLIETYQASTDGFKNLESGGNTGFDKKDYLAKLRLNTNRTARVYQALTVKASQTNEVSNETYLGLTDTDFGATPNLRYAGSQEDVMTSQQRHYIVRHLIKPSSFVDITTTVYRTEFARDWYKLDRVRATTDGDRISIGAVLAAPELYSAEYAILRGNSSTNENALELKHNNREYFARGVQSVVGLRFDSGEISHDLEVGVRYHEDELDRYQWVDLYRMQDTVMELTDTGVPGTESNRIESATALSSYAQYSFEYGRSTFTPGVRYEHIELTREDFGKEDPQRLGTNVTTRSNTVDVLIPGIGFQYDFSNRVTLFSGVHQGFAPPGSQEGARPEKSINYEIGTRYRSGVTGLQAVVFFNDYSNLLGSDLAASGGQGTTEQFNGGEVNASGLEVSAGYDFAATTSANISIPMNVAYTFTKSEFVNSFESDFEAWGTVEAGDQLPYVPSHQLSIGTALIVSKYSLNLNGKYVSRMRTVAGQESIVNSESTDAHFIVDVAGEYAVGRQTHVFATIQNITDQAYIVARRPAGVRPGLPRLVQIGIKTRF